MIKNQMLFKIVGQFVLAASLTTLLPVDAAQFEYRAGVETAYGAHGLGASHVDGFYAALPQASEKIDYPTKVDAESFGIVTTAQSVLVQDVESGMMLLAKHPDQVRSIGSVTKLMSVLVFLDQNPDLNKIVELTKEDIIYGGRIYLAFNTGITIEDLLAASLVGSDNSATNSFARLAGLTSEEFVEKMNDKAKELGMDSTIFTDPTGIHSGNKSTARNLVKLLDAAEANDFMKEYMTSSSVDVRHVGGQMINIKNTNKLLVSFLNEGEFSIAGGKTGFLPEAGYVLATTVYEEGNGVHVIVLGSESKDTRVDEAKGLASWAFRVFKWPGE